VTNATQTNEVEMPFSPEMEQSLCKDLSLTLAKFPKVRLGHLPTPLEPMDRLSEILGGPRLWVKRDDCTGLSSGGNKTRKLEFLMADAQSKGADTIILKVRHNLITQDKQRQLQLSLVWNVIFY